MARPRIAITKRTCIVLMLLLVAGAIVNVAVAWGFSAWMPEQQIGITYGMKTVWTPSSIGTIGYIEGAGFPLRSFGGFGERIPMRPMPSGFAINTVFYAVVLWMLIAVPFALRKRRRIKRGWCPKCAYDLRGRAPDSTVCPECGAAVGSSLGRATHA